MYSAKGVRSKAYCINILRTNPELPTDVTESLSVFSPIAIEIHSAILTSLEHLKRVEINSK